MKRSMKMTAVAMTALCLPAYAMGQSGIEVDANGDGMLSAAEVQAVYPEVTVEQFTSMDLNADGGLDDAEVQAATEAGIMPEAPSDG